MRLLLLLFILGCRGPYEVVCDTDVVGTAGGMLGTKCPRLSYNLNIAKTCLTSTYQFPDGRLFQIIQNEEWYDYFFDVGVWVSNEEDLGKTDTGVYLGFYNFRTEEILLSNSEYSLAHEMLHRIDHQRNQPGSWNHENWNINGYEIVIASYHEQYKDSDAP